MRMVGQPGGVGETPPAPAGAQSRLELRSNEHLTRNRRAPLSAEELRSGGDWLAAASRPTPSISGERRPFDSAASEPRRLRPFRWAQTEADRTCRLGQQASGNARSRAERPTVAGCIFRCEAIV